MTTDTQLISTRLEERRRFWQKLKPDPNLAVFTSTLKETLSNQGKLFIIGNGGSACEASHLAAEMVNRFYFDRPALAALALTCDTANLTAIANDSDYSSIFSRQLLALARQGDMLLALTTGGQSANILQAIRSAREIGVHCTVLCGSRVEALQRQAPDLMITVDSTDTPTIQEAHLFYIHLIAEIVEKWVMTAR